MKKPFNRSISMFAALVILLQLTGCNLLRSGANEYNDVVALVQGVQSAASNFQLVTDTQYAKIQAKTQITKDYYDAVSNSGEVWTGNFRSEQEILNELLKNYRDEKDLAFIPVTKQGLYRKWYLATLRDQRKSDYMKAFAELVIAEVRNSLR